MQEEAARRSAFVLRIWQDDNGRTWGQVTEPMSGWKRPFDGVDQLCRLVVEQMAQPAAAMSGLNENPDNQ